MKKIDSQFRDFTYSVGGDEDHLGALMMWLCGAQDVTGCGGVAAAYDLLEERWGAAYRETTGYIIPTFLRYAVQKNSVSFRDRAVVMADWELGVQCEDGAFGEVLGNGLVGKKVFNTGQVILGLCVLYDETGDSRYLLAAKKAADWLLAHQEENGSWVKYTTAGARTYHTRVAWALLEVWKRSGKEEYKESAVRQLEWTLVRQNELGWFKDTSLTDPNRPWTHLVGYTIAGLFESALLLGREGEGYLDAALHALIASAQPYIRVYKDSSASPTLLPTTLDSSWGSKDRDSCLTGNAQIAFYWLKGYLLQGNAELQVAAEQMIRELKRVHVLEGAGKEIVGGVPGSYPVNGAYCPYMMINWGAKFFADLLLLHITKNIQITS